MFYCLDCGKALYENQICRILTNDRKLIFCQDCYSKACHRLISNEYYLQKALEIKAIKADPSKPQIKQFFSELGLNEDGSLKEEDDNVQTENQPYQRRTKNQSNLMIEEYLRQIAENLGSISAWVSFWSVILIISLIISIIVSLVAYAKLHQYY